MITDFYNYDEFLVQVVGTMFNDSGCILVTPDKQKIQGKKEISEELKKYSETDNLKLISCVIRDNKKEDKKLDFLNIKQNIQTYKTVKDIEKEIATIKDNQQTTTDIVNLFTDIDKNRTNLEEQNKEISKRLDKVESTLEQILALLQKS